MTSEKRHWIKPLRGRPRPGRHLLLWVDADETKTTLRRLSCRAWDVVLHGQRLQAWCLGAWSDAADLERLLDGCSKGRGTLTIWIARGWEDLVLTGLAQLLDCKACTWRYALLDGQRVLIRGLWRGKPVVISSLPNWTGHRWDLWSDVFHDTRCTAAFKAFTGAEGAEGVELSQREEQYLRTWCAVAQLSVALSLPALAPTVAGAGMLAWRQMIGPRLKVMVEWSKQKHQHKSITPALIVAPSPFRPARSQCAERHSAYGLITRQLRRGFVDEMIHCVDLRSAYLLALCTAPLPLNYTKTLHQPQPDELAQAMQSKTAHALVRIRTNDNAYPVRYSGKVRLAQGHFWTWLAGSELALALLTGECAEIQTAHLWDAQPLPAEMGQLLMAIPSIFASEPSPAVKAAWRSFYSALVGQFAGRRKIWQDCPQKAGISSWAEWESAVLKTGEVARYRSIAGHTQRLVDCTDTSSSVPFFYGCITAHVRAMMLNLLRQAGPENVVCLHCDSLWVTRAGWQQLQAQVSRHGLAPDSLACKATYDRAWMTGKSVVVIERNGTRSLKAPGLGDFAALDETCRAYGLRAIKWSQCESVQAQDGCRRRKIVFAGQQIIDQHSHAPVVLPLGEPIDDPLLRTELLQSLAYKRSVIDEP